LEEEWTFANPFDFWLLTGSIKDWLKMLRQVYTYVYVLFQQDIQLTVESHL